MSGEAFFTDAFNRLGTETAFAVLKRARELEAEGRNVVHLEIGDPDFSTPKNIVEAARQALADGRTHYSPSVGNADLREAIAADAGIDTWTKDNVVVVAGGKPVIFYLMLAVVRPGDEVLMPDPGFPIYRSMTDFCGATAVPYALHEDRQFRPDVAELKSLVTPKTRLIIMNTPHNPTGAVLTAAEVDGIAEIMRENPQVLALEDAVYDHLLFDGHEHVSLTRHADVRDRVVVLNSLSKRYAATGLRVGWALAQPKLVAAMARFETNSTSCVPDFLQAAAVEALTGPQDEVERMRAAYEHRRKVMCEELDKIDGLVPFHGQGAFYVWIRVETGHSSKELAHRLLEEAGVAALDGGSFGPGGAGYIRYSVATSEELIREGCRRTADFLAKIKDEKK